MRGSGLRALGAALVGALVLAGLLGSRLAGLDWQGLLGGAVAWARDAGPAGWALFVLCQTAVAMVGMIPASLLGIAAGAVYGVMGGFVLAAIGTLIGGWAAFLLARSLLRPVVARMLARRPTGSRLARLDGEVARDGWRFVCLLRVSPVMPFAATSYALGLTRIGAGGYLLGTLASLPALLGYVAAGTVARAGVLDGAQGFWGWAALVAGGAATVALAVRSGALLARCGLLPGVAK